MSDHVLCEIHGGVATVTLNRPEARNAFDDALIATLTGVLADLDASPAVRAVVLEARGASFCAGADLGWMRRMADASPAANDADAAALARLMRTLDRLGKPTIAVVQGPAHGGGVGLVACCDIALAADSAAFCLSEVRLGLIPAVIMPYVVAAIGARHARRYTMTAETIPAARASEIGLVHEVALADSLPAARDAMLRTLLQGAPGAQAAAKDLIDLVATQPITDAIVAETARRIARRRASEEGREGVAAFLARRPPSWRAP